MPAKRKPELEQLFSEKKRLVLAKEIVVSPDGKDWGTEKTPLLSDSKEPEYTQLDTSVTVERVILKKHITLLYAIGLIIGGVAGSGIFISPTGVTLNAGSVGSSLIIWALAGSFNLLLAVCYAELGTALPVAGGDYAYLKIIMGPLPAFLSLWTTTLLIAPSTAALMGRTVSVYIFGMIGMECDQILVVLLAIWVTGLYQFCILFVLFLYYSILVI